MGVCQSEILKRQSSVTRTIDKDLRKAKRDERKNIKLLLLGPGECGKSTILKQMQIIHSNGFSDDEIAEKRLIIYSNIVTAASVLLQAMQQLEIQLEKPENEAHAKIIQAVMEKNLDKEPLSGEVHAALKELWLDSGVLQCFERRNEFQLHDSAKYFLDNLDRVANPGFRPNEQDILRTRIATTGVVETRFMVKGLEFRVFDVGGQRSERRKWIHCFDNVNAIIFIVAISEYDQVLMEDESMNRMTESLKLFSWVCNSPYFFNTSIILFMNKKDLFEEKLKRVSIKTAFPDYEGGQDYNESLEYVTEAFLNCNTNDQTKEIKCHPTCATDTDQVKTVINSVSDILIEKSMGAARGI